MYIRGVGLRLHKMSLMSRAVAFVCKFLFDDKRAQRRRKRIALKRKVLVKHLEKLKWKIVKGGRRSINDRDFEEF